MCNKKGASNINQGKESLEVNITPRKKVQKAPEFYVDKV